MELVSVERASMERATMEWASMERAYICQLTQYCTAQPNEINSLHNLSALPGGRWNKKYVTMRQQEFDVSNRA